MMKRIWAGFLDSASKIVKAKWFPLFAILMPFISQVVLSIPWIWIEPSSLPLASTRVLVFLIGIIGLVGLYFRQLIDEKEKQSLKERLRTQTRFLLETQIRNKLRSLLTDLEISDSGRTFIYLLDNTDLYVAYERNMESNPDYRVRFKTGHGWAGKTWDERKSFPVDVRQLSMQNLIDEWGFSEGQAELVKDSQTQTVYYIAIRKLSDPDVKIGVLGIDSKKSVGETGFKTKKKKAIIKDIASFLGGPLEALQSDIDVERVIDPDQ